MKKILICFLVLCFTLTSFIIPIHAEEVGALEGDSHQYRWAWTYVNSNGDVTKCRLKLNGDNLTGSWGNLYTNVITCWNTLGSQFSYSEDKVYAYDVAFANSKCDLYTADSNSFMYTNPDYDYITAVTLYKNSSGVWSISPTTGEVGNFQNGQISYSRIYFGVVPTSILERTYVIRHEVGHVLGMGHVLPTTSRTTLMHSTWSTSVSGYSTYSVQQHEIDVLEGFYPNP